MGLMPYRHPIVSVGTAPEVLPCARSSTLISHLPTAVGRPISVVQKDHPTDAELDEVQGRYIAELKRCVCLLRLGSPLALKRKG